MSSRRWRLTHVLAVAIPAITWPFVVVRVPADDLALNVQPGQYIALPSHRRGEVETVEYRIRNCGGTAALLEVTAQSCACLSIGVEPKRIDPGGTAIVSASGRTPMTGTSRNSFNVLASEALMSGTKPRKRMMLFKFELVAVQDAALEVHPFELAYPDRAWSAGVSPVLTLRMRCQSPPSSNPRIATGSGDNLSIERCGEWTTDGFGVFSCRFRLTIPPSGTMIPEVLKIRLDQDDGKDCEVELRCRRKG
jgi:hypothetical protein